MTERLVLGDAIKALRGEGGHTHDANATHRRIIGTVTHKKRQRRQMVATIVIAFVGLPLGTTAYAAFFGAPAFVEAWFEHEPISVVAPRITPKRLSTRGDGNQAPRQIVTDEGGETRDLTPTPLATRGEGKSEPRQFVTDEVVETRDLTPTPLATRGERKSAPRQIERGEAPAAARVDASQALYARAHELHFVTRDPAAALAAWNVYLRQAPDAPLTPEAQYHRALCLVRLHQNAEAIDALTPFATGDGYRKREATRLLQALTQ
jgi:hypothetical protein